MTVNLSQMLVAAMQLAQHRSPENAAALSQMMELTPTQTDEKPDICSESSNPFSLPIFDAADNQGWIAVDLDGTLAQHDGWKGFDYIGQPIQPMLKQVRTWLACGCDVRIFTARASHPEAIPYIQQWCHQHIGRVLPVTNVKDMAMLELWDDLAIRVEQNTGIVVGMDEKELYDSLIDPEDNAQSIPETDDDNIHRGQMAMSFVIDHQKDFPHAMYRADLGWIDFIWGTPGIVKPSGNTKGGKGVAHILEARQRKDGHSQLSANALAMKLVDVIAKGTIIRQYQNGDSSQKAISYQGYEAILVKVGVTNEWLLTGWEVGV